MYEGMAVSTTTAPRARGGGLARRLLLAVLALAAVLPIAALGAQSANASVYTQRACTKQAGISGFSFAHKGAYYKQINLCSSGGALAAAFFQTVAHANQDAADWTYTAPANTQIVRLSGTYGKAAGPHLNSGDAAAFLQDSNGARLDSCVTFLGCTGGVGKRTWNLAAAPAAWFKFGVMCGGPKGCPAGLTEYALGNMSIGLDDNSNPDVSSPPTGPLMSDAVLHGKESVALTAHDTGSGLLNVALLADGKQVSTTAIDDNGGACKDYDPTNSDPYEYTQPVPCKLTASGSFDLDTTPLSDGSHQLEVQVSDAAGNTSRIGQRTAVVDNQPPAVTTTLTGDPHVGQVLTCNPTITEGQNPEVTYEWLRIDPSSRTPAIIPAQVAKTYTLTAADQKYTIKCRVTATDKGGSASATSNPSAVVAPAQGGDKSQHPPNNGGGATATATVTAHWSHPRRGKSATIVYGYAPTITGKVVNAKGQPISQATIDLIAEPTAAGRKPVRKTGGITKADGSFVIKLGVNIDSRRVRIQYRPNLAVAKVGGETSVNLKVRAKVELAASHGSAVIAAVHPVLRFAGRVRGPRLKGQLVEIRVQKGRRWIVLGQPVRVDRHGRYHLRYRSYGTVPHHVFFRFKAVARAQRGYGFLNGSSRVVKVRVR